MSSLGTIYQSIEILSKEKGIDPKVILDAVKDAMLVAARKQFHTNEELVADMDERTGAIHIFGVKKIVEAVTDPDKEISLEAARRIQMIRPWLRQVGTLSRSSINSANPDRYLPRPIAKATETRTCMTLPDGRPSLPEQHQASD